MSNRPFIQKSIVELEVIFEENKNNVVELKKLSLELSYRKVPRAVALTKKVSDFLKSPNSEEPKIHSESPDSEPEMLRRQQSTKVPVIECQSCGQKLRINLGSDSREYNCPICKAIFRASYSVGVLSVLFVKTNPKGDDTTLSLKDAYKLFEADETSPWEQIELTRRRLIQQYHPDKVASLGPKLKEVADKEGKRINIAYSLIRKAKGI